MPAVPYPRCGERPPSGANDCPSCGARVAPPRGEREAPAGRTLPHLAEKSSHARAALEARALRLLGDAVGRFRALEMERRAQVAARELAAVP